MKKLKVIISGFIVALTIPTIAYASVDTHQYEREVEKYHNVTKSEKIIPVGKAKKAVKEFLEEINSDSFKPLKNPEKVKLEYKMFDLDEKPVAYYFTIYNNGKQVGYFVTSSRLNIEPILEYGVGTFENGIKAQEEIAKGNKVYYFGAYQIMTGKNVKEVREKFKKSKTEKMNDASEKELKSLSEMKDKTLEDIALKKGKKDPQWASLTDGKNEENTTEFSIASSLPVTKQLPVDHISQSLADGLNGHSACGPATAAMIVDYYHDNLNYNVYDNAYYGNWGELVDHMYTHMAYFGGSTLGAFSSGLFSHVQHKASERDGDWITNVNRDGNASGAESDYMTSIVREDPVGFRFDFSGGYYEYHFVAGIGYENVGGDLDVYHLDPDGSSGVKSFDYSANKYDMEFGYVRNRDY